MKIRTRLKLNSYLSVGVVFLTIVSVGWSLREASKADDNESLAVEMRKTAYERTTLRDEYLLNHGERARIQWYVKTDGFRGLLAQAYTSFPKAPDKAILEEIRKDFESTVSIFGDIVENHKRERSAGIGINAATEGEMRRRGQIFLRASSLNDNIGRLHQSAERIATGANRRTILSLIMFIALVVVTTVGNSAIVNGILTRRIAKLREGTEIIGAGNLDHRIDVKGDDELSELAKASNDTAAKLKESYTSVENLNREIERRKRTEEELRETSDYLDNLIGYANAPIIVWDAKFRITRFNHAFEKMTGRKAEDVIGHSIEILFPPDLVKESMQFIGKTASGERWETVEIKIHRLDGSVRTVLWNSATLFTVDGKTPVATIAQGQDITERKHVEDKLKETMADLERSNKELEQFAYVASHDLQEPLRMVSSYTQLLAERYENQLDDKAKKFIHYAVDGTVRMQLLINDLLTYSRIGTRGKPLELIDAQSMLGEAINNLKMTIDETKAIITNDELPNVLTDASQLVQLFQNLIGNAMKFRGEEPPHVHISAREKGREWLFSVSDNGIGIDPQYADKIFVIFQRLHTKEEYPGSGIGLAICKKIVERHGGRIWFESEPGKGTTFYFLIPK